MASPAFFSENYAEARSRFREHLKRSGGQLSILELASRDPTGNALTIDIGRLGPASPDLTLLHSSGLHGVEGFAGSAIQLQFLADPPPLPPETAVLLVHVLNPFGMSWIRRTNEHNVDLNRNFLADGNYRGAPARYAALDRFLNPKSSPSNDLFLIQAAFLVLRYGMPALRQAVAGGQYVYERGLFYGGNRLEEELHKYHAFLKQHLAGVRKLTAIDVHTGLGKFGEDSLIVDTQDYERLLPVFGSRVKTSEPERGPAYVIRGGLSEVVSSALPDANRTFITQEFGTYSSTSVLRALREENRWHHYGDGTLDHPTKRKLKSMFFPVSEKWRRQILDRGRQAIDLALKSL